MRDIIDQNLVDNFYNNTGEIGNFSSRLPVLNSGTSALGDDDDDGMPNYWEKTHNLNYLDPNDRNQSLTQDSYTNLEVYLNSL